MPKTINVLFLAAEADPFVKVGGLGDVAGSLPRALRSLSDGEIILDVRLVIPYHPVVKAHGLKPLEMFSLPRGTSEIAVEAYETSMNGLPVYLINGDPIRATGSVYSLDSKLDAEKYTFFSLAALALQKHIHWSADILHANDWHTAVSIYASLTKRWEENARPVKGILTLHNMPFMGSDVHELLQSYGIKLSQTDLPEWARVLPLPLGLWASDSIVAVSPTYGREILTSEYGSGLEVFLQTRQETIHGILNGIDAVSFNPATDPALGSNFEEHSLAQRAFNKTWLQEKLGLASDPVIPLLAIVSRMDIQKGVDMAFTALKSLKSLPFQAVILGTGDPKLEEAAQNLHDLFPEKIKVQLRYDAALARQIYAGADMLLMPSRYEPCGLSQMIAMRYGCVPIVRAAGGLHDTVQHGETGFVFEKAHPMSLMAAIKTGIKAYKNKELWSRIQRAGMQLDFSWESSARKYLDLYKTLVKKIQ